MTPTVTIGIPTHNRAELLQQSIRSALAQSYEDFRILICDNASYDNTREVVSDFADSRIEYVRSDTNLGMKANFNRLLELTQTDALVLLSDDDVLYRDYLASVVPVLEGNRNIGVVHTAVDLIDTSSRVLLAAVTLLDPEGDVTVESGQRYLERSMQATWTIALSSALFRTEALRKARGFPDDDPSADALMLMRIALDWDFAMVSTALAGVRIHPDAATASLGEWTGDSYDLHEFSDFLFERRVQFLKEARLTEEMTHSYEALARRAYRGDALQRIAVDGGGNTSWSETNRALLRLLRREPKIVYAPATWRLVAAQLGGRQLKRVLRRR